MSSPNGTRRPPHPTARAFFDALENDPFPLRNMNKNAIVAGWRNRYSQAEHFPVKVQGRNFSVKQVQRGEVEGTYGTGATVWPASMVLMKYMERNHLTMVNQKSVIDLGAGTGITSVAAALLGAKHVVCTDGCENVVQLAQKNIESASKQLLLISENNTKEVKQPSRRVGNCNIQVQNYLWGDGSLGKHKFDVILVSDCVLPKLYPIGPLVDGIDELLSASGVAILSYEHRYYPEFDPKERFRDLIESRDMVVDVVPSEKHDPVFSVDDIEIWHVRRKLA